MLSKDDNELMCRVGPATKMGAALRCYWIPALLASEVPEADGDPVRVQLLGESFVVFRDTRGQIGFLDEACCHCGASLSLGRVEDFGIRCLHHGWKFAVDGTVLETPNVHDPDFKTRFRANSHPLREAGGFVWVYLGAADRQPHFPAWPWLLFPETHLLTTVNIGNCNWVQIVETLLDSSPLGWPHADGLKAGANETGDGAKIIHGAQADQAPRLQVEDTNFGFHYAALRRRPDLNGKLQARVTAYLAPFTVLDPNGNTATFVVPIDDSSCLLFHAFWSEERKINEEPQRSRQLRSVGLDAATLGVREGRTFNGLPGINAQDGAVSVSSGAIRDRSRERLSTADDAIQRLYRTLLALADGVEQGEVPIGLSPDVDDTKIVGAHGIVEPDQAWQSLTPGHVAKPREMNRSAAKGRAGCSLASPSPARGRGLG